MTKKPPILSDEGVAEHLKERFRASHPDNRIVRAREWLKRHNKEVALIKEAQRDADFEWYKPLIKQ